MDAVTKGKFTPYMDLFFDDINHGSYNNVYTGYQPPNLAIGTLHILK
jgi:hypothetical protein